MLVDEESCVSVCDVGSEIMRVGFYEHLPFRVLFVTDFMVLTLWGDACKFYLG